MPEGIKLTLVQEGDCHVRYIPDNKADGPELERMLEKATCGGMVGAAEEVAPAVAEEAPEAGKAEAEPVCLVEPEKPWKESLCGQVEQVLEQLREEGRL